MAALFSLFSTRPCNCFGILVSKGYGFAPSPVLRRRPDFVVAVLVHLNRGCALFILPAAHFVFDPVFVLLAVGHGGYLEKRGL